VALAYVAVLDNGMNTHLTDISYDRAGENGNFNKSSTSGTTRMPRSTISIDDGTDISLSTS
jgi:hypothetical protein